MLRKYRNALLDEIKAFGLDPRGFKTKDEIVDGYDSFRLQAGDIYHYFLLQTCFKDGERQFFCKYSIYTPDHPRPTYIQFYSTNWVNLESIEQLFRSWLSRSAKVYFAIQAEEAEDRMIPDLWAELDLRSDSSIDSQNLQNTPFSVEEQERIIETLNNFEKEVQEREILSAGQINLLHERVQYLVDSSTRLGRKDWLAAAAGALIGFTFQAGLTSDVATLIINLAGEALRWIAHTPLLLP